MSQAASTSYWRTDVSEITPETVYVRGYQLEGLIGLPFSATTFLLIRGRLPTPAETRVLDAVLTAVLDYGLEKAGTAAARFAVSCNPNVQAGLATAVLSAGEHGLSTENTARFIRGTHDRFVASGEADMVSFAEAVVAEARATKLRIPGFGHPVFKYTDPRAEVLKQIAVDADLWSEPIQLYEAVHRAFVKEPGREHFPINDVAMMAAITIGLGFSPEESAALSIIGTLPGVVAHISEELASGVKGRRILDSDVDYEVPRRILSSDLAAAGWGESQLCE